MSLMSEEDEEAIKRKLFIQHDRWTRLAASMKDFSQKIIDKDFDASKDSLAQLSKNFMVVEGWIARQLAIRAAHEVDQESFHAQRVHQEEAITQAVKDIEISKVNLQEAKLLRKQNEEYEALKDQIMQHQGRSATIQQCRQLEADIESLKAESLRLDLLADKRRKQFALLHHCLEDLVELDSNEEPPDPVPEKTRRHRKEDDADDEDDVDERESSEGDAMQIDE